MYVRLSCGMQEAAVTRALPTHALPGRAGGSAASCPPSSASVRVATPISAGELRGRGTSRMCNTTCCTYRVPCAADVADQCHGSLCVLAGSCTQYYVQVHTSYTYLACAWVPLPGQRWLFGDITPPMPNPTPVRPSPLAFWLVSIETGRNKDSATSATKSDPLDCDDQRAIHVTTWLPEEPVSPCWAVGSSAFRSTGGGRSAMAAGDFSKDPAQAKIAEMEAKRKKPVPQLCALHR